MSLKGSQFRYLFKSAEKLAMKELSKLLEPLGITPNQGEVLVILGSCAPLSLKELGNLLICEEKSPSRLVQSLIKKGLLSKEKSSNDGRSFLLSLTPAGQELLPKIKEQENIFDQNLEKAYPEIEHFSQALREYTKGSFYEEKLKRRFLWNEE
ncbi:MarR family winged helix-turn-helix transcriptional regulator [Streptococcus troglodytae]|uniref:MarR family transcriptional regulator n=1 Tax=Streptococcus troglodytae TaxID=1111760 RepID=A0A1L7LLT5_9STRE|nr:winged helix DNA-binding protein [Streptococcus troglodytae]BAQ24982.1 MarR family transcriptional regulator [Streptococcus troglodytae]